MADPFLARRIRAVCAGVKLEASPDAEWSELMPLLDEFWLRVQQRVSTRHAPGRLKLWLNSLRRTYPQAEVLYHRVRGLSDVREVGGVLGNEKKLPIPPALS